MASMNHGELVRLVNAQGAEIKRLGKLLREFMANEAWFNHSNGRRSRAIVTRLHNKENLADLIVFDACWSGGMRDMQDVEMGIKDGQWSPRLTLEDLEPQDDIFSLLEDADERESAAATQS